MIVHFVCEGNNFRSRLSEAILNSKKVKSIQVISSGIHATRNNWGPISWDTARILKNKNLIECMSTMWQQTTKELLDSSDLVIFMEQIHYLYCKDTFGFTSMNYEIWDVEDTILNSKPITSNLDEDLLAIQQSEKTYSILVQKIDGLMIRLQRGI